LARYLKRNKRKKAKFIKGDKKIRQRLQQEGKGGEKLVVQRKKNNEFKYIIGMSKVKHDRQRMH
jgi:hypothetical protein